MANVIYNSTDIETVISNSTIISNNISSTADAIDGIVGGVDRRVYDYFEFFRELNDKSNALRWEESNANGFGSWMNDTYNSFLTVKGEVESNSGKGASDLPISDSNAQFPSVNVDPTKVTPYDLTSDAWDKLSTEDKKVIEAKLRELGFTDKEIQAIKDGNASVNKTVLDKLCTELIKLNNNGSDVRQVILEKYGFDIFNEDGTIDKDKLAYAMLIDNKNPNDDYDLVALLKNNYGIDLFPEEKAPTSGGTDPGTGTVPTNPTNPETPTGDQGGSPSTVHTGSGYGGGYSGIGDETDLSEIDNMLNGQEDESLLDGLSGLSGSLLNKKDSFNIGFKDGDSKGGAGAAVAGLAGLGAAATAAGLLAKKKKEEAITGEDDDDEFDDDFDEDDLIEDAFNEDDDDDFDNTTNKNKKKKDWLYGLGIGLAGAGLATGLIAKDDDEDEDDY